MLFAPYDALLNPAPKSFGRKKKLLDL